MSDNTSTVKSTSVPDLIDQLKKGKKLHDEFAEQFNKQYLVAGKIMSDWKAHFKLRLPPDLDPKKCQELDSRLMELHQEATFLKAACDCRLQACKNASSSKYREKYTALVTEYQSEGKKLPAKETLQALAEFSVADIVDAVIHAEIEVSFWKDVLSDLQNCRKLIDNATLNLSVEAKALQAEKYYDNLNRKLNSD